MGIRSAGRGEDWPLFAILGAKYGLRKCGEMAVFSFSAATPPLLTGFPAQNAGDK
jgi:hypothetical protein